MDATYQPLNRPTGLSITESPKPKREPEVLSAMGRINFGLDQLGAAIAAMAEKVSPVLRQEPPTAATEPAPAVASAQLAVGLNDFADRILRAQRAVDELRLRVEL